MMKKSVAALSAVCFGPLEFFDLCQQIICQARTAHVPWLPAYWLIAIQSHMAVDKPKSSLDGSRHAAS